MSHSSPSWPLDPEAQRLYDLLPVGICMVAPDGRYLAANAAYGRYVGYGQDELARMSVWDITHPEDRDADARAMEARLRGPATAYEVSKRYVHRDGRVLWQKLQVTLVRDDAGQPLYSVAVMRDIGDLKQAEAEREQQEARLRTITDAMPQMVWSTRADGHHDYFNQQWYDFTGAPQGATDGDAWSASFHPDDQARTWAAWRHSLATGETYEIRYRLRHRSGEYRWVLGRALPVRDGATAARTSSWRCWRTSCATRWRRSAPRPSC
jgi:PAS domain S-box-containing protein